MIPAPDNLFAFYETDDGGQIGEMVRAFDDRGRAMILNLSAGTLMPVRDVDMKFLGLAFVNDPFVNDLDVTEDEEAPGDSGG